MNYSTNVSRRRALLFIAAMFGVAVLGISLVAAQQLNFHDGRLNQTAYFGGDALYCVDKYFHATNSVQMFMDDGGFRLLSKEGQALWFVPYEDVEAAQDKLANDGVPVLIAMGQGSYGESALYANTEPDGDIFYIYTGFDEHGKSNSFTFYGCLPAVLSASQPTLTIAPTLTTAPTETMAPTLTTAPTETVAPTATTEPTLTPTEVDPGPGVDP